MIFKKDYLLNLDVLNQCIKDGKILNSRLGLMFKCLARSINSDCMFTERLYEHDSFFTPKNETEQILWENLRTSAKIQINSILKKRINGQKGGRPKKEIPVIQPEQKQEKPVRGTFVPPTLEEVVAYAKQMCELPPVMGGFMCSKDMVIDFFYHYDRQGWMLGNNVHMTNWKSALKKWCAENIKKMN